MRRNHSSKTGQGKWAEMGVFGRPRFKPSPLGEQIHL